MTQSDDGGGPPPLPPVDTRSTGGMVPPFGAGSAGAPEPPGEALPLGTRIARLFSAPSKAFFPPFSSAMWILPIVIASLFQVGEALLLKDLYSAEMTKQMESFFENREVPDEQREKILARMEEGESGSALVIQGLSRVAVVGLLYFLIPAAVLLFGANFVMGASAKFGQIFTVTAFSALVTVPRELLLIPLRLVLGTIHVYTGPAALLGPEAGLPFYLLLPFDIFELYRLFVLALGLVVVARISRQRAFVLVGILWFGFALLQVGGYLFSHAMGMA